MLEGNDHHWLIAGMRNLVKDAALNAVAYDRDLYEELYKEGLVSVSGRQAIRNHANQCLKRLLDGKELPKAPTYTQKIDGLQKHHLPLIQDRVRRALSDSIASAACGLGALAIPHADIYEVQEILMQGDDA